MEQNTLRKQRELTDRLNRYRNEYYNYNNPVSYTHLTLPTN